jgi:ABC-type microcin C transport system duplicated ATPase subunit YejF
MRRQIWYLRPRDLRFLGLIAVTGLAIAMHLDSGLRLAGQAGSGWRTLDLDVLKQRIETGELRQRESDWYHPATEEEMRSVGGAP